MIRQVTFGFLISMMSSCEIISRALRFSESARLVFPLDFFLFTRRFSQTATTNLRQTFHAHDPRPGLQNKRLWSLTYLWCRSGEGGGNVEKFRFSA